MISRNPSTTALIAVGSGLAGLSAALAAADMGTSVTLLTAGALLSGSSPWAQGGIAAVGEDDSPRDTRRIRWRWAGA